MSYFRKIGRLFVDSFKLKLDFVYVYFYELLFVFAVALLTMAWGKIFNSIGQNSLNTNLYAVNDAATNALKLFLVQTVTAVIAFAIALGILYMIFQALSWATILKTKPRFLRFSMLNVGWLVGWAVVGWFFITYFKESGVIIGMTVLLVAFLHLTNLFQHALLTQNKGFKSAVAFAFSTGVGKIHLFIVPYILAAIAFLIWSQLWRIIPVNSIGGFAIIALMCIIIVPFLTWYKFYLHRLLSAI